MGKINLSPLSLRWIAPAALALLFGGLILGAAVQFNRTRTEFDESLKASLLLEGHAREIWLSERLDPFFSEWRAGYPEPLVPDLTGASWLLLDASGEIATDGGNFLPYADPASASREISWREDIEYLQRALVEGEAVTSLEKTLGKWKKRAFIRIRPASGAISTRWILVGQTGEGEGGGSYFAELFQAQRRYWARVIPLSAASLLFLALLFRAIARNARLERGLREAEESIELESLTSTLAHELRNPLAIVQSCAEIIARQETLSPDGRELVSDLIAEVRRSQDVLARHLHPGRYSLLEIKDLVDFARQFWQRRQALLATHNLALEWEIPEPASPIEVTADPQQLEKILDNLLRNSIEAMPEGGRVCFSLEEEGRFATASFRDNGPGLKGALFFPKGSWELGSAKSEGKGVGLRLARKWVAKWGGELFVRNLRRGFLRKVVGAEVRIRLARVGEGTKE